MRSDTLRPTEHARANQHEASLRAFHRLPSSSMGLPEGFHASLGTSGSRISNPNSPAGALLLFLQLAYQICDIEDLIVSESYFADLEALDACE